MSAGVRRISILVELNTLPHVVHATCNPLANHDARAHTHDVMCVQATNVCQFFYLGGAKHSATRRPRDV